MHVLIFPSWYFPADSHEIAGRMFHQLAAGLREEGVDARIFYPEYSSKGPLLNRIRFQVEQEVPTWRVFRWALPKANAFLYKRWINKCVADLRWYIKKEGMPDLIHAQSYQAASVCAAFQKKVKVPYIYTERLSGFLTREIPKFHLQFFKDIFSTNSLTTCVSPGLMTIMEPHASKPMKVIPNFFEESIFFVDPTVKKDEVFTWVSIGEPASTKGLDILLQTYAALKQVMKDVKMKLILIDRIPEQEELHKLATALGIANEITWTGLISQNEIAHILRQSHVLVSASRIETFGKTIIEAHGCGLPVVATKTDGAKFIMTNPALGELAEVNNVQSLRRAMGKVKTGYAQYNANSIHDLSAKRFSKKVVIRQWIQQYKSLVS
jgi:glycosyltransferase involved in cell wall biosynthesis